MGRRKYKEELYEDESLGESLERYVESRHSSESDSEDKYTDIDVGSDIDETLSGQSSYSDDYEKQSHNRRRSSRRSLDEIKRKEAEKIDSCDYFLFVPELCVTIVSTCLDTAGYYLKPVVTCTENTVRKAMDDPICTSPHDLAIIEAIKREKELRRLEKRERIIAKIKKRELKRQMMELELIKETQDIEIETEEVDDDEDTYTDTIDEDTQVSEDYHRIQHRSSTRERSVERSSYTPKRRHSRTIASPGARSHHSSRSNRSHVSHGTHRSKRSHFSHGTHRSKRSHFSHGTHRSKRNNRQSTDESDSGHGSNESDSFEQNTYTNQKQHHLVRSEVPNAIANSAPVSTVVIATKISKASRSRDSLNIESSERSKTSSKEADAVSTKSKANTKEAHSESTKFRANSIDTFAKSTTKTKEADVISTHSKANSKETESVSTRSIASSMGDDTVSKRSETNSKEADVVSTKSKAKSKKVDTVASTNSIANSKEVHAASSRSVATSKDADAVLTRLKATSREADAHSLKSRVDAESIKSRTEAVLTRSSTMSRADDVSIKSKDTAREADAISVITSQSKQIAQKIKEKVSHSDDSSCTMSLNTIGRLKSQLVPFHSKKKNETKQKKLPAGYLKFLKQREVKPAHEQEDVNKIKGKAEESSKHKKYSKDDDEASTTSSMKSFLGLNKRKNKKDSVSNSRRGNPEAEIKEGKKMLIPANNKNLTANNVPANHKNQDLMAIQELKAPSVENVDEIQHTQDYMALNQELKTAHYVENVPANHKNQDLMANNQQLKARSVENVPVNQKQLTTNNIENAPAGQGDSNPIWFSSSKTKSSFTGSKASSSRSKRSEKIKILDKSPETRENIEYFIRTPTASNKTDENDISGGDPSLVGRMLSAVSSRASAYAYFTSATQSSTNSSSIDDREAMKVGKTLFLKKAGEEALIKNSLSKTRNTTEPPKVDVQTE